MESAIGSNHCRPQFQPDSATAMRILVQIIARLAVRMARVPACVTIMRMSVQVAGRLFVGMGRVEDRRVSD